jgi:site-specific DNA-methyltransferase (adenine-specific)
MPRCRCGNPLIANGTGRPRCYCSDACRWTAYRRRRKRHRFSVHFSTGNCEWSTPQNLFDDMNARYGPFTLDVAATAENAKCACYYTRDQDGLAQLWAGRVWMNAPYGRPLAAWLRKALASVESGDAEIVVCLVPVRTDTRWWHEYVERGE